MTPDQPIPPAPSAGQRASSIQEPYRPGSSVAGPVPSLDLNPVAGILAFMFPGLGYAWYGEIRRAVLVFVGIGGLFFGGLLVGGISTIDRYEDKWWFFLQCGVGPLTFVADHINQSQFKVVALNSQLVQPKPDQAHNGYAVGLGKVNEVAALSCGLAGMLNLIAVIDCLWRTPRPARKQDGAARPLPTL